MVEAVSTTLIDPIDPDKRANVEQTTDDPGKCGLVVVGADGKPIGGAIDFKYKIRDIDEQATYTYFGKQAASGAWQVMRLTNATNAFEYAYGTSNYSTAWTGRASLSYGSVQ